MHLTYIYDEYNLHFSKPLSKNKLIVRNIYRDNVRQNKLFYQYGLAQIYRNW